MILKRYLLTFLFIASFLGKLFAQVNFTEHERFWIKNHPKLTFGVVGNWAPYEIIEQNRLSGIVQEYLEIFQKETGVILEMKVGDPKKKSNIVQLQEGSLDFIADLAITSERKKIIAFTEEFASEPLIICTRLKYKYVGGLSDLKGKKVAVPSGYYSLELLKKEYPTIQLVEFPSIEECLMALTTEKVDASVDVLGVIAFYMNHHGYTNLKIAAPTEYKNIYLAMAVNKKNDTLLSILNKVLSSISDAKSGEIRQKWIALNINPDTGDKLKSEQFKKMLAIGGLIIFFGVLWIWYLRRRVRKQKKLQNMLQNSLQTISLQNEERKVLLKEVHHRVKNNLQFITSLLKLQASKDMEENKSFSIDESINRIQAIGVIHEKIYRTNLTVMPDLKEYVESLVETIVSNYSQSKNIQTTFSIQSLHIKDNALVPLAIIINELVVNSIKHAFKQTENPTIHLTIEEKDFQVEIQYSDNGNWINSKENDSFGKKLIAIFCEQLNGNLVFTNKLSTNYTFRFPMDILSK